MADAERPPCPKWVKFIATGGGVGEFPFAPGTWGSLAAILLVVVSEPLFQHLMRWFHRHSAAMSSPFDGDIRDVSLLNYAIIDYYYPIEWFTFFLACFFLVIGIFAGGRYAESLKIKDPSCVVIDEFAGQTITLLGFWGDQPSLLSLLLAFTLFRILDIWKPWPIRWFEKLPGGWGIMMDDVVAGIIGAIILATLVHFHWLPGMQ
jgi:phosphatidylglycerophosphatase A